MGYKLVNGSGSNNVIEKNTIESIIIFVSVLIVIVLLICRFIHYKEVFSYAYEDNGNWTDYGIDDPYYSSSYLGLLFQSISPELLQMGVNKSSLENLSVPMGDIAGKYVISLAHTENNKLVHEDVCLYISDSDLMYYTYSAYGDDNIHTSSNLRDGTYGTEEGNKIKTPTFGVSWKEYLESIDDTEVDQDGTNTDVE